MFWMLRTALVVGVIFYLSPVRHAGENIAVVEGVLAWIGLGSGPGQAAPAPATEPGTKLESLWQALPDAAKRAVVDEVVARAIPGAAPTEIVAAKVAPLNPPAAGTPAPKAPALKATASRTPASKTPAPNTPVDTLHSGDRAPAWRGESHRPAG